MISITQCLQILARRSIGLTRIGTMLALAGWLAACSEAQTGNSPTGNPDAGTSLPAVSIGAAPLQPALSAADIAAPATIMIVGDSISAAYGIQREHGWVALLDSALEPLGGEHRVINASISGETTGGGLARLPAALAEHDPDLVVIELGGNDGLRGYPVPRLRSNLAAMIEESLAAEAKVLLVGMQIPPNYGPRYTQAFAATFTELADEYEIDLVPSFLEKVALAGNLMQADGIHPTAAAQPLLLQAAWPSIAAFLTAHQG